MRRQSNRGSTEASLRERTFFDVAACGMARIAGNGLARIGSFKSARRGAGTGALAGHVRPCVRHSARSNIFGDGHDYARTHQAMDYQHLIVQRRDGVMTIALNRPEVLNSFNRRMADELVAALQDADDDADVRAVLVTGSGRAF